MPSKRYHWNGRFVSKKLYDRLVAVKNNAERMRACIKSENNSKTDDNITSNCPILGDRVIDINYMSQEMICNKCKESLVLKDIYGENKCGLGSYFKVRCKCGNKQTVKNGPLHTVPGTNRTTFQVNSKLPIGAICAGIGHTQVDKFLSYTFDMPALAKQTYKSNERAVGPFIEKIAEESCNYSIEMERALTLEHLEELKKKLPPGTPDDFLVYKKVVDGKEVEIVRLFASFDFGWSERANGYNYDSLNGYGCLIGMFTGMVLDYVTFNRKCRQCDFNEKNNVFKKHDCRLNFHGSAKAMEAAGARLLVVNNPKLIDANVEIGVFIADNDSSSISALQNSLPYKIIKQSDMNHTKKGVGNVLHSSNSKNKDPDNELQNDTIKTLQKYFSYAVKQNVGNLDAMQKALRNIPDHAFGRHENCGSWCKADVDKENYVGLQMKSLTLYEELKVIFNKLADNATKFLMAASSQANESLNNSMCSKAPKRICYSTSESSDFRFAATVAQKNYTESFVASIFHALSLKSSMNLANRIQRVNNTAAKRKLRESEIDTKRRRIELRQNRSQLKYRKEKSEGISYSSNMALFDEETSAMAINDQSDNAIGEKIVATPKESLNMNDQFSFQNDDSAVVFFDLETGGFDMFKDEVLQVSMKCGKHSFDCYITPTRSINPRSSDVHNLTKIGKNLFKNGKQVDTVSKAVAVSEVLKYLKSIGKKCILVAHKCEFDSRRLVLLAESCDLLKEYQELILGFIDTLPIFKKKVSNVDNYKLTTLAVSQLGISCEDAHDAQIDVIILEQLSKKLLIIDDLVKINESFTNVFDYILGKRRSNNNKETFLPLKGIISNGMLQRLSESKFSYHDLVNAYKTSEVNAKILLERREKKNSNTYKEKSYPR